MIQDRVTARLRPVVMSSRGSRIVAGPLAFGASTSMSRLSEGSLLPISLTAISRKVYSFRF